MKGTAEDYIDPMTHPLGSAWRQPEREEILMDDDNVFMTKEHLRELNNYSTSVPTGAYIGKMWRAREEKTNSWLLCWFAPHQDPKLLKIKTRQITVI